MMNSPNILMDIYYSLVLMKTFWCYCRMIIVCGGSIFVKFVGYPYIQRNVFANIYQKMNCNTL